jgi:TRAP-type mannitol/chloroaromatic compound transport system permease small subunit
MGGDKPIGLAIGVVATTILVLLPAMIVPIYYLFANVYALITGSDFSSDTMNVAVFLIGLVMTVALFLLLMAGAVALVGRALSPKTPEG